MEKDTELRELERSAFRVANEDGLTELWMGLMMIAIAALLIDTVAIVLIAILIIFQTAFIERVRERYTYPRIGKVKLRAESEKLTGPGWVLAVLIGIVAFSSVMLAPHLDTDLVWATARWAPVLISVMMLHPSHLLAQRTGRSGYYLIAVLSIALAAVLVFMDFATPVYRALVYMASLGSVLAIVGIVTMVHLIHRYPVSTMEELENASN